MYWGNPGALSSRTKWTKVVQQKPELKSWTQWRNACKLFCRDDRGLDQPLGDWKHTPDKLCRQLTFYFDKESDTLYRAIGRYYLRYTGNKRGTFRWITSRIEYSIPPTSVPVEVTEGYKSWHVKCNHQIETTEEASDPNSFQEYLSMLDPWESYLFTGLKIPMGPDALAEYLQCNAVTIVSDGSVKKRSAGFGWAMVDPKGDEVPLVEVCGPVFGSKPASYRAEAYGILSVLRFLIRIKEYYGLEKLQIHSQFCDNERWIKTIKRVTQHKGFYPNDTLAADWDVIQEIKTSLDQFESDEFQVQWVKGHMDDVKPWDELTTGERTNCKADEIADIFCNEILPTMSIDLSKVPRLSRNKAQLQMPGGTITNKMKQEIRIARTKGPLVTKIMDDNNWDQETFKKWTGPPMAEPSTGSTKRKPHL